MAAAYAALVSLMNVIHDIQHHPSPPISLDDQPLNPITQHIIFFLDFLQAYSPPPVADNDEESADPLEMCIANAAFAAEDAIESHIVDSIQSLSCVRVPQMEPLNANDEKIQSINLCRDRLQSVIKEMDMIKNLMVDTEEKKKMIAKEMDTIKNLTLDTKEKKKMVAVHDQLPTKSVLASVSCKQIMVGLDYASHEIMEKLIRDEYSNLQITTIVGMGGIGKTFLAKSIYEAPCIKDHFDICAWATVSQQNNTREILREILLQVTKEKEEELSGKSEDELGLKLRKFLFGRRFLIVLDDMWSVDAWDKIQRFFPKNETGSQVLVTTRQSQLGLQLNPDYSHRMSFLDKATSWDLFSKTVFGDKRSCPLELKEIGEQIVDNCRGLPLSIVVVGGLLKKTDDTWESIRDNMSSLVNMENNKHCLKLLKMSYNQLPIYLKPCFLYMGVFKEDYVIGVSMLTQLWVSEGFLKPSNGEAMETTARGFLQDLIDRNLVLIDSWGFKGKINCCKIHDLVRDMCLKEGQKDGLYHVMGKSNHHQDMNTLRRVVITMNTSTEKVCDQLRCMPYARSVISENDAVVFPQNPGLLRTLHAYEFIRGQPDETYMTTHAFRHVNLRHLSIRVGGGDMSLFLHSISLFWNLHTLIVGCRERITLPSEFWKMPQFRHIKFVYYSLRLPDIPCDERDGESIIMENLYTLIGVRNLKCCRGMVKRIPNLKSLKLLYDGQPEGEYFIENIEYLCRLESLSFKAMYSSTSHSYMERLTFPQSLRKLIFVISFSFQWDDVMTKIGLLPLLEYLELSLGCFKKGKWETVEGQFPCLKYLKLGRCKGLEKWTAAEEGSILPRLEHLRLASIGSLKEIPLELGNIDTLKKIELLNCGDEAVKSVEEIVDEQVNSQGQLSFHVRIAVKTEGVYQSLKRLAGPQFEVIIDKYRG